MTSFGVAAQAQREAAGERVRRHAAERRSTIELLATPGGLARADEPERVAKRLDRLSRYFAGEELPSAPSEAPSASADEVIASALERGSLRRPAAAASATEAAGVVLERIVGSEDYVDVRYLEAGMAAARAVCRVRIRDEAGKVVGNGSGSLVSPRLMLTNHHVLESAEVAAHSAAEFNYQDGVDGQPLHPRLFHLDPDAFFLADEERDFALVAVKASEAELAEFGFNPLVEAEGKAVIGEFVTVVQHPGGEKKQVSLRENRIVDLPEGFMHYEADTEPGSSGSPVFNDQWEVVALHHASVPVADGDDDGYVNEGVRISRLLAFLGQQRLPPEQRALLGELRLERTVAPQAAPEERTVRVTVPLEISVRVAGSAAAAPPAPADEAIVIDPDYASRRGYDPGFLGSGPLAVALPALAEGPQPEALAYHNFSVAMNPQRRLARFTAVNIDGALGRRLKRESDRWFLDPRIPAADQIGEAVYADNDLDRGHLVRRLDPAWGADERTAKLANDDTFHFTNCTPQHKDFNQRQTSWAGLEDYILENAENREFRVSVFTGPVFAADDDEYRGVALPRQFWKVAVMVKANGRLSATAYLLSQESLIEGLETEEEFSYGAYRTFQVRVAEVERLTALSFGPLAELDPLASLEATTPAREIASERDLVL